MTTQATIGPIDSYTARQVGEILADVLREALPLCKHPIPVDVVVLPEPDES